MKQLHKFLCLPQSKKNLLIICFLSLIFIKICLFFLRFNIIEKIIAKTAGGLRFKKAFSVEDINWVVSVLSRHLPFAVTCLPRSLAVQFLLKLNGDDSNVCIGITKNNENKLEAHAWVESKGIVVTGDKNLARYIPLVSSKEINS